MMGIRKHFAPWVVLGAGKKPTKSITFGIDKKHGGGAVLSFHELKNDDWKYDFCDSPDLRDISGTYFHVMFCKIDDFRRFVSDMKKMLAEWEEYEKGKNGEKDRID